MGSLGLASGYSDTLHISGRYIMKLVVLQLLTAITATGMITFTVTHMHMESFYVQWLLWATHWLVAIPIAFITVRWIAPIYKRFMKL
jgi:hypothetical protein